MIFAPVRALYSVKFYCEYLKKSGWKAFWFTVYLFAITAVLIVPAVFVGARPQIVSAVDKIARYIPQITIENGKITVNEDKPLTIEPPELKGYKIYFNTGGKDPVYPTEMETSKTLISVNSDTVYFKFDDNFQEAKASLDVPKIVISSDIITQNKPQIVSVITWAFVLMRIIMQVFIAPFMIALAFLTIAVVSALCGAQMRGGQLFKAACYMQPAAVFLSVLLFALHTEIAFVAYVIIFAAYSYLACKGYVAALGGGGDTSHKA